MRVLLGLPTLVLLSVIVFLSIRLIPGDVCTLIFTSGGNRPDFTQEDCDSLKGALGLDKPLVSQYFDWTANMLQGDMGRSLISRREVLPDLTGRMKVTMELALLAGLFSTSVGVPIGVLSALKQNSKIDYGLRLLTVGWLSMPSFWVGTLLLTLPALWFGYSPPIGYQPFWVNPWVNLQQMYMPVIAIGLAVSASMARLTRSSMLEVMREDYVRTARAKGLGQRTVIFRHALRTALLPIVTLFGLQITALLSGSLVIELIFAIPGVGQFMLSAIQTKDFPIIQAGVMFFGTVVIFINIIVDISYSWLDPRLRAS
jgi:peptide/nickel transport system permease protein